jgi:hypothetical protein
VVAAISPCAITIGTGKCCSADVAALVIVAEPPAPAIAERPAAWRRGTIVPVAETTRDHSLEALLGVVGHLRAFRERLEAAANDR